ncbi:unnamed protein product [Phytomonas sp. Hart1]|nr:unnamed protein product [Phytomonas sp. Hart1]|eukprot:CCW68750.1 unnamed protein product [Phytomonas sp. isolate Hart1]
MPRDRNAHINELKNAFPQFKVVKESQSELIFAIEGSERMEDRSSRSLTLLVSLSPTFPQSAPSIAMSYLFFKVPMTKVDEPDSKTPEWDPETSSLVECVRNAFNHLWVYWGTVSPPSMGSITEQLSRETDRLLVDLNENPNCLDAYCYQLPIMKQMREMSVRSVNELESLANANVALRTEVESLYNEVKTMQSELYGQMNELEEANQNKLIISVCTPEALVKTLEADLRKLHEKSRTIAKTTIDAYGDNKKNFQESFEVYRATCKKMHEIDLKLRAYRTTKS